MPRRRKAEDGIEALISIAAAHPTFGFWVAAVFAVLAVTSSWFIPTVYRQWGPLVGIVSWILAVAFSGGAFLGVITQSKRLKRLEETRSFEHLSQLSWQQFEQLVADVYKARGYQVREVGGQNDGGIDLVLTDANGTIIGVQCKRWKNWRVGSPEIRDFVGALAGLRTPHGIFVASGTYTAEAIKTAGQHGIELVDGETLLRMVGGVHGGASVAGSHPTTPITLPPQPGEDYPACPKCGSAMVRRTAQKGPNARQEFWGCSTYPRCRGTRPA